jgi:riboflavin biosynthesis pyrimidine reductase
MLHQLTPLPGRGFSLDNPVELDRIRELLSPAAGTWMRATMVTNSHGATTGKDGTSNSLSRGADRTLLGVLRSHADAVVLGATTLRHERIPIPQRAALVILSHTGTIAWDNLVRPTDAAGRVIVMTTSPEAELVASGDSDIAQVTVMEPGLTPEKLASLIRGTVGGGGLLIEGGRNVWKQFAPLCDDLWLAVSPPPVSDREGVPSWWPVGETSWDLSALYTDEARMLYYHHRAVRGAP